MLQVCDRALTSRNETTFQMLTVIVLDAHRAAMLFAMLSALLGSLMISKTLRIPKL